MPGKQVFGEHMIDGTDPRDQHPGRSMIRLGHVHRGGIGRCGRKAGRQASGLVGKRNPDLADCHSSRFASGSPATLTTLLLAGFAVLTPLWARQSLQFIEIGDFFVLDFIFVVIFVFRFRRLRGA